MSRSITPQPATALSSTRLVRFLRHNLNVNARPSQRDFSERLGEMIDLNASIDLATTLADLKRQAFEPGLQDAQAITRDFLRSRKAILKTIAKAFDPSSASGRLRFPSPRKDEQTANTPDYEPYQRFYSAMQAELDHKIRTLHKRMLKDIAGISPRLQQLCLMDAALAESIQAHCRSRFAQVPRLLRRSFTRATAPTQPGAPEPTNDWPSRLAPFKSDMREALLAESEAKLLPVIGLVDALNEEISTP